MFAGLYSRLLTWKMLASDILSKSYPAAYENHCVILCNILIAKRSDKFVDYRTIFKIVHLFT
jgi:hypothetical protein